MTGKRSLRPEGAATLLVRLKLLPLAERSFVLLLFVCAAVPPLLFTYSELAGVQSTSPLAMAGRHPLLLILIASALVLGALTVLEPPRALSIAGYLRQLRARQQQVQFNYDAALRRLHQEQHHVEDDSVQPRS